MLEVGFSLYELDVSDWCLVGVIISIVVMVVAIIVGVTTGDYNREIRCVLYAGIAALLAVGFTLVAAPWSRVATIKLELPLPSSVIQPAPTTPPTPQHHVPSMLQ